MHFIRQSIMLENLISFGGSITAMKVRWLAFLILVLSASPASLLAQYSTISGSVLTNEGNPILDLVRIQWMQNGRSMSLTTDYAGRFAINFLSPGRYVIEFDRPRTGEKARHEAILGQSDFLLLTIIWGGTVNDVPSPILSINIPAGSPDAWPSERTLTESSVESLPETGNLSSILSNTEGSVVAEWFDVAGMHSYRPLLIGVHGSSWTQNQATLNGVPINHPLGDGMFFLPDLSALDSVTYTIGSSPASNMGPGAHFSMISKTGERQLHGEAYSFLQCGALQNVNPTDRYKFFGITESDERWKHDIHGGFQLGGPLGKLPWTYFGAVSVRDIEKRIRNHTLPVTANVSQESFNLIGQLSSKDQLGIYWSGQRLHEPQANASPQITRESSLDQTQNFQTVQSSWTRFISSKNLLETRVGVASGRVDSRFQKGVTGQSRENLFPGYGLYNVPGTPYYLDLVAMMSHTMTGPAPMAVSSNSSSLDASVLYSIAQKGKWNSNHRVSVGASVHRGSIAQDYDSMDAANLLFFNEAPDSVRLINTPARTRDRVWLIDFHGSERLSIARWSIAFAASTSISRGASILHADQSANPLEWTNVSGRIGVAYKATDKHPLVLNAGAAQIYNQPLAVSWNATNPNGPGWRLYQWTDINADGLFQQGENTKLLKVVGAPYARMDPDLKNPKTLEVTLGLTQGLTEKLSLKLSAYRRFEHHLMSLVNEGVPFSSYTPVQVADPGPDGEPGTQDDRFITVYNQAPETLGQDRYVLTNPDRFHGFSEGMEMKLIFSSGRFRGEAMMTRFRAVAATAPGISVRENDTSALLGVYDDPNKATFARGSTYFDRGTLGRLWMTAMLPWGIHGSMIGNYQDGLPYSRYLPVQGLNQGLIGVLTRQRGPGAAGSSGGPMTAHYETFDARIRKDISLPSGKLTATLDIFNLTNRAQPLLQMAVTSPTHYWRIPLRFQVPRSMQLGLKYKW
jgi:hypothetical protein